MASGGGRQSAHSPVAFGDRSRSMQVVLAAVIPAAIGALAGILVGVSSGAYWAIAAIAAIGAVLAGFEHPDARSAARRGLIAGLIYGIALLLAHAIAGTHAKVSLGQFPPLLALITAIAGLLLSAAGARIARFRRGRGDSEPTDEEDSTSSSSVSIPSGSPFESQE